MNGFSTDGRSAPGSESSASRRDRLRRCTPMKVTIKPVRSEKVFVPEVVLNPRKRISEATIVAVEKQT